MKDETFSTKDKIIQIITEEEEEPHAHKPFMAKVPVKATPIGYEFHQVEISDFDPQKSLRPSQQRKIQWDDMQISASVPVFLKSRVNEEEVLKYLTFIQNYLQQKVPDYFLQSKIHFIHGVVHMTNNSKDFLLKFLSIKRLKGKSAFFQSIPRKNPINGITPIA